MCTKDVLYTKTDIKMKLMYHIFTYGLFMVVCARDTETNSTDLAERDITAQTWMTIITALVSTRLVLSVIGIVINAFNSAIICKLPKDAGEHFKLILSLAAADISLCFSDLLMLATYAYYKFSSVSSDSGHIYSEAEGSPCVWAINDGIQFFAFLATLFSVMLIAVDCYLKTKVPLRYKVIVTKNRIRIAVCVSWILAFLMSSVTLFGLGFLEWQTIARNLGHSSTTLNTTDSTTEMYSNSKGSMSNNSQFKNSLSNTMPHMRLSLCDAMLEWAFLKNLIVALCSMLCTVVMIVLYCLVCCGARNLQHRREKQTGVHRSIKKTLLTTILIVGTFAFCWGPVSAFMILLAALGFVDETRPSVKAFLSSSSILQILNASLDALIYAIRLDDIRTRYTFLCNKLKCKCRNVMLRH